MESFNLQFNFNYDNISNEKEQLKLAKITLVCEQCGGQCDLDDSREFGFCNRCGTKILIQSDVVQNTYNTTQHIVKHFHGNVIKGKDADELIISGEKFLKAGQTEKAAEMFYNATEDEPENWHAWFGLAQAGGYSDEHIVIDAMDCFHLTNKFAPEKDKESIMEKWITAIDSRKGIPPNIFEKYKETLGKYEDDFVKKYIEKYVKNFEDIKSPIMLEFERDIPLLGKDKQNEIYVAIIQKMDENTEYRYSNLKFLSNPEFLSKSMSSFVILKMMAEKINPDGWQLNLSEARYMKYGSKNWFHAYQTAYNQAGKETALEVLKEILRTRDKCPDKKQQKYFIEMLKKEDCKYNWVLKKAEQELKKKK